MFTALPVGAYKLPAESPFNRTAISPTCYLIQTLLPKPVTIKSSLATFSIISMEHSFREF